MESNKQEEQIYQEIDNLGPFLVDDLDMTPAVTTKIKQVITFISEKEQMSFSETYQKLKSSPVYSLLTDDYLEALTSNVTDIYDAFKQLENRKQR